MPQALWVLALDTSTPRTALCVGRLDADLGGGTLVASQTHDERANQASRTLVGRLEALCAQAGVQVSQLDRIACGRGPGTFTGTRVATATAKGLALGLGCQVIPVSTLAAIAASGEVHTEHVLATVDARRGEVYGGLYRRSGDSLALEGEERCAPLSDLLGDLPGDLPGDLDAAVTVVGSGVEPYRDALPPDMPARAAPGPDAEGLWRATLAAARDPGPQDAADLDAVYLRKSYAELGINRPKRPAWKSPFV